MRSESAAHSSARYRSSTFGLRSRARTAALYAPSEPSLGLLGERGEERVDVGRKAHDLGLERGVLHRLARREQLEHGKESGARPREAVQVAEPAPARRLVAGPGHVLQRRRERARIEPREHLGGAVDRRVAAGDSEPIRQRSHDRHDVRQELLGRDARERASSVRREPRQLLVERGSAQSAHEPIDDLRGALRSHGAPRS
ncbi:hypothetical protein [Nannocystis pusilla]|uniref:hypothetical protein n=1 Tax=Nannocystis pusilla TaxID=889268 RepID=UPI003DA3E708